MKKKYSTGLYTGFKGSWSKLNKQEKQKALKKRWYVRWSYRNPKTGMMERQGNVYGGVNECRTYKERIEALKTYQRNLIGLIDRGYNPFDESRDITDTLSVKEAISEALKIKQLHMKHESFTRFKSDIRRFHDYLNSNGFTNRFITSVTRKTVTNYLNAVLRSVSTRTRNNYRTSIGTLWQTMEDEGMIEKNFVKSIKMLKSVPKQNKPFKQDQFERISKHLGELDPRMHLVFLFVTYNLLRPKEVCRLTAGDFDLNENTFRVEVKSGLTQTRIIPSILLPLLPKMNGKDSDTHLLGRTALLEPWNIRPESKRGKITLRFREVLNELGFGEEYGLYSGRHYAITKIYRALRKQFNPYQSKTELMLITGHQSMKALESYIRNIGAELPQDYSELLK
ncbi:MAG: hypothetical protein AAGF96_05835 [Bacteroidota bacterium]